MSFLWCWTVWHILTFLHVHRSDGGGVKAGGSKLGRRSVVRFMAREGSYCHELRAELSWSQKYNAVLRHLMVWYATKPFLNLPYFSPAFTAKWRNQKISAKTNLLLSIPMQNMNLRINPLNWASTVVQMVSCTLVALGYVELRSIWRILWIKTHRTHKHKDL